MISIIPQDFMRYSLTLRENICISDLARSDTDRDILEVLEMVKLDIDPSGLNRTLGENSMDWSFRADNGRNSPLRGDYSRGVRLS